MAERIENLRAYAELLREKGVLAESYINEEDVRIKYISYNSRDVKFGTLFICKGAHFSVDYLKSAIKEGACAYVSEVKYDLSDIEDGEKIPYILVNDMRKAMAYIADMYYDHIWNKLNLIGFTGTKGKSTTTYFMRAILDEYLKDIKKPKSAVLSGINNYDGISDEESHLTTPETLDLYKHFNNAVNCGIEYLSMEVSSQALKYHRTLGVQYEVGCFLNIGEDHISDAEHKDFDDYMYCKSLLFRQCKKGIFNGDSEHLEGILKGHTCEVETFGYGKENDLRATNVELFNEKGALGVKYDATGLVDYQVEVNVPGSFSVYNSLTAIAICHHFGVEETAIKQALRNVNVKGRIEIVPVSPRYTLMIDYAHNAMSLESLLTTLKAYHPTRLVCLFGCGGNRAKSRRYEMGEVSSRLADLTVITSDNPRDEEPMDIIEDILIGVKKADGAYVTIPDRKEAIGYCMLHAKDGDIIVLAGKQYIYGSLDMQYNDRINLPSVNNLGTKAFSNLFCFIVKNKYIITTGFKGILSTIFNFVSRARVDFLPCINRICNIFALMISNHFFRINIYYFFSRHRFISDSFGIIAVDYRSFIIRMKE